MCERGLSPHLALIYAIYFHHFGPRDTQLPRARHSRNTLIHARDVYSSHRSGQEDDIGETRQEMRSHRARHPFSPLRYDRPTRSPCLTVITFAKKSRRTRHGTPRKHTRDGNIPTSVTSNCLSMSIPSDVTWCNFFTNSFSLDVSQIERRPIKGVRIRKLCRSWLQCGLMTMQNHFVHWSIEGSSLERRKYRDWRVN